MDHENIIRALVRDGNEFDKLEFKRQFSTTKGSQGAAIPKLAKLVSAIANTDRPHELNDYGYIILGAERRAIVGGMEALQDDRECATLVRNINSYLTPPVRLDLRAYEEPGVGWFAALVILPRHPITGAHFIAKAFNDGKLVLEPGQCFVRVGEETKLAQREDHLRLWRTPLYPDFSVSFLRGGSQKSIKVEQFSASPTATELMDRVCRMAKLRFELKNTGDSGAEDVEVVFALPDGVSASADEPEWPTKPEPPRAPWDPPRLHMPDVSKLMRGVRSVHDPAGGPYVKNGEVRFTLKSLNHGRGYDLFNPVYLVFPRGEKTYEFPVTVYSTRPGPPSTEMLTVTVLEGDGSFENVKEHVKRLSWEDRE